MAFQKLHNSVTEQCVSQDSTAFGSLSVKGTSTSIARVSLSSSVCIIELENSWSV